MNIGIFIKKHGPLDTMKKDESLFKLLKKQKTDIYFNLELYILANTHNDFRSLVKEKIAKQKAYLEKELLIASQRKDENCPQNTSNIISSLIRKQKGNRFSYNFVCRKCGKRHTGGYLYTDDTGKEYEVCKYCRGANDYISIVYTLIGNKR